MTLTANRAARLQRSLLALFLLLCGAPLWASPEEDRKDFLAFFGELDGAVLFGKEGNILSHTDVLAGEDLIALLAHEDVAGL